MTTHENGIENSARRGWEHTGLLWVVRSVVLFSFWLVLSGHFEVQYLVLGVVSSILTVAMTKDLLRPYRMTRFQPVPTTVRWMFSSLFRFSLYVPYLAYQIARSNVEVAYLVLHPRMPISPRLVEFETPLKMEPAQVLLAQSITLTPGTITVDVHDGRFLVHSLYPGAAQGLIKGGMPRRVGEVFGTPVSVRSRSVVHTLDDVDWFYGED